MNVKPGWNNQHCLRYVVVSYQLHQVYNYYNKHRIQARLCYSSNSAVLHIRYQHQPPRSTRFSSTITLLLPPCELWLIFEEPCISYDRVVRPSVHLSVCPSVTHWQWVKTTQARIMKSSLTDSPRTLVLAIQSSSRNSKRFNPREGVKWEWWKIRNIQPISRRISETVQDRTKVTIND